MHDNFFDIFKYIQFKDYFVMLTISRMNLPIHSILKCRKVEPTWVGLVVIGLGYESVLLPEVIGSILSGANLNGLI